MSFNRNEKMYIYICVKNLTSAKSWPNSLLCSFKRFILDANKYNQDKQASNTS